MTPRRPWPAPTDGRNSRPGGDGTGEAAIGARLGYLLALRDQGEPALAALVAGERRPWQPAARDPDQATMLAGPRRLSAGLRDGPAAVVLEFLGSDEDLRALGAYPAARAGDYVAGWVALDAVAALAAHPATLRIELLRKPAPTGLPPGPAPGGFVPDLPSPRPLTGRGVTLAVIDLGFDVLHPAFIAAAPDGSETVRTRWLHDTTLTDPTRDRETLDAVSRRFDRAALQAALDWYRAGPGGPGPVPGVVEKHLTRLAGDLGVDQDLGNLLRGHGTAVAGIAAGNGRSDKPPGTDFVGVAPEADLVFVAMGLHDETRFADSPRMLAAFADAFADSFGAGASPGPPCVALMSDADMLGPHDGSLLGERFLDALLLLPGRALTLVASNMNHPQPDRPHLAWHAMATPPAAGGPTRLTLRFEDGCLWSDCAEIWFTPDSDAPEARIARDAGPPVTVRAGDGWTTILGAAGGDTVVEARLARDDAADAHCLRIVFRIPPFAQILRADWTIEVPARFPAPVHGWIDRNNEGRARWTGQPAADGAGRTTMGSPDTAVRALSVGAARQGADGSLAVSAFSGRGPLRGREGERRHKPDLLAVGEDVRAPQAQPQDRVDRVPRGAAYAHGWRGTSFAAPQIAGACALLFERYGSDPVFGPVASWADLRQAVLQAAVRPPGAGPGDARGWDPHHGYGVIDFHRLLSPPAPAGADLWLAKAPSDTGEEPFVAARFWDSPAIRLEDAAGRPIDPAAIPGPGPLRVRVRVGNRGGAAAAAGATVALWWAPPGALHPLPGRAGAAWQPIGTAPLPAIPPGGAAEAAFDWTPKLAGGALAPHALLATVDAPEDPFDPADTLCAQNNAAVRGIAPGEGAPRGVTPGGDTPGDNLARFRILGSDDTDGLIAWSDRAHAVLTLSGLPVSALPWREAAMFEAAGSPQRPLHGEPGAPAGDPALGRLRDLDGAAAIAAMTDVLGATMLRHADGLVTLTGGPRLVLPRLRIREGAPLDIALRLAGGDAAAMVHLMHLSGGRRVGGGSLGAGVAGAAGQGAARQRPTPAAAAPPPLPSPPQSL